MANLKTYVLKFASRSSAASLPRDIAKNPQQRILALGTFDGVHLGHQSLIRTAGEISEVSGAATSLGVVTFYPHPKYVLASSNNIKKELSLLITPLRSKRFILGDLGVEELFIIRFTRKLAELDPETFIQEFIVPLNPLALVVGSDWCFGKDRSGDTESLARFGLKYGFEVRVVPLLQNSDREVKIGSRQIRSLLEEGQVRDIMSLLGRPFSVIGRVIKGDGRGRKIGFPTANIHLSHQMLPASGVYKTKIVIDGEPHLSVSNVGFRPTFSEEKDRVTLETHILNFDQDLYGKKVQVIFLDRIREEKKFKSVDELKSQINLDILSVSDDR